MKERPETIDDEAIAKLYTTQEVAELLGVTSETVRDWIKAKRLPAIRLGGSGHWRVRRPDLLAFANSKYQASPESNAKPPF